MGDAELDTKREILWRQYALPRPLQEYLNLALKINGVLLCRHRSHILLLLFEGTALG